MIKPYFEDAWNALYLGDSRDVLAELPEKSVDCVMTSPPYLGLRSYKCDPVVWDGKEGCEHEWGETITVNKGTLGNNLDTLAGTQTAGIAKQANTQGSFCLRCGAWRGVLGMEPTPQLYITHLCGIFDQVKRVLKDTGVIFVNLGDSYSGSGQGGGGGSFQDDRAEIGVQRRSATATVPTKSLIGIPARFQIEMIDRGWICRNVINWYKRSCMPESVKDRFTRDFESIFFFSKQGDYFFEQQFEHQKEESISRYRNGESFDKAGVCGEAYPNEKRAHPHHFSADRLLNQVGRNKRTTWDITSGGGTKFDHYASYPPALCETPIKAGCPEYICPKCGTLRKRMHETESHYEKRETAHAPNNCPTKVDSTGWERPSTNFIGYSDCGCGTALKDCISGVVLDPFAGTGTTLAVAKALGRKSIGIDVSESYVKMAVKRLKKLPGVQKELIVC
jgi:site-specific DNA-methyltransferase (adenine-specific)